MDSPNISQRSSFSSQETSDLKRCWICFGTDDDDDYLESNRNWVSPCKCRGSLRWVHQDCVQGWVKERVSQHFIVHCPQCLTRYIFGYKEDNYLIRLLNKLDKTVNKLCPCLAYSIIISAVYWLATYYGIITVVQIMGEKEAITMMEKTNSFKLLFVLPSIPVGLLLGRMINWEDILLLFVQRLTSRLPILRTIMPPFLLEPFIISTNTFHFNPITNFCTALLLPTTATVVGNLLFNNSSYSCLQKTLLGGLVYITVKGAFRIYQKQYYVIKEKTRIIIDYPETDTEENN